MLRDNAGGLDHIPLCGVSQLSHHDDLLPVTLIDDGEHGVSVVLIAEFDFFYKPVITAILYSEARIAKA